MLFNDPVLQDKLDTDGFVLLDNFYTPGDIADLRSVLQNFEQHTEAYLDGTSGTINKLEDGLFFTRHFQDLNLEENIRGQLSRITMPALQRFLSPEYKNVAALGILKQADSPSSVVDMHVHHSNLAPGSPLPGLSLFAPLNDLDDALGPLAFIRGSQNLWKDDLSYSMTYIGQSYPALYPLMESYLTNVCPTAGQAIVFNQFTIHRGLPNTHKTAERLAITAEFIPADQQCVLFLPEFDNQGEVRSLHGRRVEKLPLEFGTRHRWIPENLGDEVYTLDPYSVRDISAEKFKRCCRR